MAAGPISPRAFAAASWANPDTFLSSRSFIYRLTLSSVVRAPSISRDAVAVSRTDKSSSSRSFIYRLTLSSVVRAPSFSRASDAASRTSESLSSSALTSNGTACLPSATRYVFIDARFQPSSSPKKFVSTYFAAFHLIG